MNHIELSVNASYHQNTFMNQHDEDEIVNQSRNSRRTVRLCGGRGYNKYNLHPFDL